MKKWLLVPGIVFVIIFITLLLALPKPEQVATMVSGTPKPNATPVINTGQKSVYQDLYDQISGFTVENPALTAPNFDRKISLPKEE